MQCLWRAHQDDGRLRFDPVPQAPARVAFLGVRPCDLAAIAMLDRVHLGGPFEDPDYRARREASARQAMDRLLTTAHMIRDAGLPCDIVSAGGTGTYDITGRIDGVTEIQAGSYVLMDTAYARLDIPFEQALSVLGTVLSRPTPTLCVADCGHKSCTFDHGNPSVKGIDGASALHLIPNCAQMASAAWRPSAQASTMIAGPRTTSPPA